MAYRIDQLALTESGVQACFADRVERRVTPSSVYAVFGPDGISYSGASGDIGGRTPTVDTAYRIASCTKSFTAAALLILVERGRLALDDPITRWVSAGPVIGPDGAAVRPPTVGELASMSGGLPTDDPWADRQESLTTEAFGQLIGAGIRFIAEPGERYEYSNLGFALLGQAIEKASGRSYIDFVTQELITPLGLTGIGYDETVQAAGGVAVGCRDLDGEWVRLPHSGPGAFSPIGGLFATPRALSTWARWLNADDDHGPLPARRRRSMQQPHTPLKSGVQGAGYGYGLVVEDHPRHGRIVSHSGGYPGFGAHLRWHADSGIGIVAFENATYSRPAAPATAALELILDEMITVDQEPQLWPETRAARQSVERLLRRWDDQEAAALFADNVDLDDSLERRRSRIEKLAAEVDLDPEPEALTEAAPFSRTPAHLAWTVLGRNGSLRCEIQLNPQQPPRVQTLTVRRG